MRTLRVLGFPGRRPPGDGETLGRALEGDARARRALAERLGPFIKARVLRATRGARTAGHEVEDLVHEVWTRLLADDARLLREWDPERASLPGYVNLLTGQVVSKTRRAASAQRRAPAGGTESFEDDAPLATQAPPPDEVAAERARLRALWAHLEETLPAMGRLVLKLLYVDHRAPNDIARDLNLSVATVHGWRHKIKRAARAFEETGR